MNKESCNMSDDELRAAIEAGHEPAWIYRSALSERLSGEHTIDDNDDLAALLVGRTIVAATREPTPDEAWPEGANSVTLRLDNGAEIEFSGWGYDSSGCTTVYTPHPEKRLKSEG